MGNFDLFQANFEKSWLVGEECADIFLCPLDPFKYSESLSADVTFQGLGQPELVKDKVFNSEYGLLFYDMEFEMYGKDFSSENTVQAKAIDDKQTSGFINLDQLILKSVENNMIPENQFIYSIYAGDGKLQS